MTVNEGHWSWLPSDTGLAMTCWSLDYDPRGYWNYHFQFVPLVWRETICRWLDEQVKL